MTSRTRLNGILDKYRTKEECVLRGKGLSPRHRTTPSTQARICSNTLDNQSLCHGRLPCHTSSIHGRYDLSHTCIDKRDEDEFLWPEPETKEGEKGELAPVSAFAQELRLKVTTYFKAEAARRGVPLLEATKVGAPYTHAPSLR